MELKDLIQSLPNNVSGDGKNFVASLKKVLGYIDENGGSGSGGSSGGSSGDSGEEEDATVVAQVISVSATEFHTTNANGNVNNVRVSWDYSPVNEYQYSQIWIKSGSNWSQAGTSTGNQYVIENLTTGQNYSIKVVACGKNYKLADFTNAPSVNISIRGSILICSTPTQFYYDDSTNKWKWTGYTDNGYTDFFELRLDQNAGVWSKERLDSVPADTFESNAQPYNRIGTAYLYVRNIYGQYNTPATCSYTIPAPNTPTAPTVTPTLDGVVIELSSLPSGCTSYVVSVDNVEYEITTKQWVYYKFSGSVSVKYCFVDTQGRSEWSPVATADIQAVLDSSKIPTITQSKLDSTVQSALSLANSSIQQAGLTSALSTAQSYTDTAIQTYNTNTVTALYATKTSLTETETSLTTLVGKYTKGDGYLIPAETHAGSKSTSTVGQTVTKGSNIYYWLAIYNVSPNEVYNVVVQTYATAIYHIIYTDDDDKILARNTGTFYSNASKYKNYDFIEGYVTIPANATKMWVTARANQKNTQQDWSACIKVRRAGETYSAITQLDDALELKVSTTDFTGDKIVNKVNSASITITGDKVSIDADHSNISGAVISEGNLKANSVTSSNIKSNAITTDKIDAGAITAAKISANAIQIGGSGNNVTIQDGAINGSKIQANSIYGDKIAANTITSTQIDTTTLVVGQNIDVLNGYIQVGGTNGNVLINDGAITADKLNVSSLSAVSSTIGTLRTATTGARTEIKDNLIEVYDSNNVLRVRMGVW